MTPLRQRLVDILDGREDPPLDVAELADLIEEATTYQAMMLALALNTHPRIWGDPAESDRIWDLANDLRLRRKGLADA